MYQVYSVYKEKKHFTWWLNHIKLNCFYVIQWYKFFKTILNKHECKSYISNISDLKSNVKCELKQFSSDSPKTKLFEVCFPHNCIALHSYSNHFLCCFVFWDQSDFNT